MISCVATLRQLVIRPLVVHHVQFLHSTPANSAARKGTREKARKRKVKVEIEKIGFIPHNQRGKDKLNALRQEKHIDDSWKSASTDNVWIGRYCKWRVYSVPEAIECHRETHHPSMYNEPNALLNVTIELNMQGEKSTRFVDKFQRMAMIPHKFELNEERNILVLAKGEDLLKEARDAGAALVGGVDVIQNIQSGDVRPSEYQYVVAHPNIMGEMVAVRGLLKRKFPNPNNGTLGVNVAELVGNLLAGIEYKAVKDDYQQNYGEINTSIGTLNMDKKHLEENLVALLTDVNKQRPKREGRFITRVLLKSPPSGEKLKIDPFLYIPEERIVTGKSQKQVEVSDEQDEDKEAEAKN
ncbi:hypothetical protein HA402_002084 [Bradysia odoriphaga]|nr:hypothetical protein HA402_002084 [Bradysia odoriphaga]